MTTNQREQLLKRRLEIYSEWKSGKFTIQQLRDKWKITHQRIYAIKKWVEKNT